jgi:hypothetical protein
MTLVQTEPKSIKIWTTDIKRETIRPNGTEKQIRPAWWQPWANTIAYYPLDSTNTVNDMKGSWTAYNLTKAGTVTFTDNYSVFNANGRLDSQISSMPTNWTVVFWLNHTTTTSWEQTVISKWWASTQNYRWWFCIDSNNKLKVQINDSWRDVITLENWVRYMVTYTWSNSWSASCVQKVYINWETTPAINTTAPLYNSNSTYIRMWWRPTAYNYRWKLSNVILENKVRTDQERLDCYNQTKWNYWL